MVPATFRFFIEYLPSGHTSLACFSWMLSATGLLCDLSLFFHLIHVYDKSVH
jgi:hypothetical protein